MAKKIKTYRIIMKRFFTAFVLLVLVVFMSAGIIAEHTIDLDKVHITIDETQGNRFVDNEEVRNLFLSYMGGENIQNIKNINLKSLEEVLENEPQIHKAQLYLSIMGDLHIEIEQHNPIVRLVDNANQSVYLSEKGLSFPVSNRFTARVPIATGNFSTNNEIIVKRILDLANKINQDDWLYALTGQIVVDEDGLLSIIPIVGDFKIEFGDAENLDEKITRLKAFYQNGLNNGIGWSKYKSINVSFAKQVVCTKK